MAGLATSLTFGLLTIALLAEVMFAAPLADSWDDEGSDLSRAVSAGLMQLQLDSADLAGLGDREKRFIGHHRSHSRGGGFSISKSELKDLCNRMGGRSKRHGWRQPPHRNLCQYILRGY